MPENPTPESPERKRLTGQEAARIREVCEAFEAACAEHIPCDDRLRACAIAAIAEVTIKNAADPQRTAMEIAGATFAMSFKLRTDRLAEKMRRRFPEYDRIVRLIDAERRAAQPDRDPR